MTSAVGEAALTASWIVAAAAIAVATAALLVFHRPPLALHVLLDMFLAAGLLRLSAEASWQALAVTASIVVLRRMLGRALTTNPGPTQARTPAPLHAGPPDRGVR